MFKRILEGRLLLHARIIINSLSHQVSRFVFLDMNEKKYILHVFFNYFSMLWKFSLKMPKDLAHMVAVQMN